jgi:hypothetical protein
MYTVYVIQHNFLITIVLNDITVYICRSEIYFNQKECTEQVT